MKSISNWTWTSPTVVQSSLEGRTSTQYTSAKPRCNQIGQIEVQLQFDLIRLEPKSVMSISCYWCTSQKIQKSQNSNQIHFKYKYTTIPIYLFYFLFSLANLNDSGIVLVAFHWNALNISTGSSFSLSKLIPVPFVIQNANKNDKCKSN